MQGGEIIVNGSVDDYPGFEMQGGTIVVRGDAGDHVGSCYPGAKYGMNRGTILIAGSAGKGLGFRMRRGTIVVAGNAGKHLGWQMRAGTIAVAGNVSAPVGVDMKRGTILLGTAVEPGVTFSEGPCSIPPTIEMLQRWISALCKKYGFVFPNPISNTCRMWNGDILCGGRGEVFMHQPKNQKKDRSQSLWRGL